MFGVGLYLYLLLWTPDVAIVLNTILCEEVDQAIVRTYEVHL